MKYFTLSQRKGIFILLIIIFTLQITYYFYKRTTTNFDDFQVDQVSINYHQNRIDSLKQIQSKPKIYPFNPNFIDDKKGYLLKMKVEEIDKILAFRKSNQYVNSAQEFQKITGVSDEWLAIYSPYFKFPDWTQKNKISSGYSSTNQNLPIKDINQATLDDLVLIKGIGPAYAQRILNERDKYNGFVHINQVDFVFGLSSDVILSLKKHFKIIKKPLIIKVNLNTASREEISKIPYINNQLAREILILRSKSDDLLKIEDLKKIKGFPLDKINIIALYLDI